MKSRSTSTEGELLDAAKARDPVATGRLITALENELEGRAAILRRMLGVTSVSHVIGITGPPGTGKSTLLAELTRVLRNGGRSVAIVAVDPSSPLHGGAILGDRIRMSEHTLDPDVFIRSMSTRGTVGGVSRATQDAVAVLVYGGWDYVLVETVGVGQDEIDVMRLVQTVVLVSSPGLGDDIQAMKAGLLEIADIHVVSKADLPGAAEATKNLLEAQTHESQRVSGAWLPPVVALSARTGAGVEELVEALRKHKDALASAGDDPERETRRTAATIRVIAQHLASDAIATSKTPLRDLAASVVAGNLSSEAAARVLLRTIADRFPLEDENDRG